MPSNSNKGIFLLITLLSLCKFSVAQNTFPASGNVGIGTLNPGAVFGELFSINGSANLLAGNMLFFSNPGNTNAGGIKATSTSAGTAADLNLFGGAGIGTGLFIQNGGNVGIGTMNPASQLDVVGQINSFAVGTGQQDMSKSSRNYANFSSNNHGTVLISSNLYVNGNDNLKIANTHSTMSGASILIPGNGQPNQGGIVFYTNQPSSVVENANFSGTMSMCIKSDGNVGIGTSTPTEKLAVNGKIRAKEIKVEAAPWPDYVFSKSYPLATLQETEKHIKEKGHLPGIPSAEEVKANGINLGEMNVKLLQKIEELTLHLIEKDKEIKSIKSDYQELKKMVINIKSKNK